MSWKFVFNSGLAQWGTLLSPLESARLAASEAGYKFFTWNGYVLLTSDTGDTGIMVEDLY